MGRQTNFKTLSLHLKHQAKPIQYLSLTMSKAKKNDDGAYKPGPDMKIPAKPKDEKAPKRAMSAYFLFANDNRQKMQADNPELGIGPIAKLLGEQWKTLNTKKKKKYSDQADKDMAAYKEKMEAHKETAYYKKYKNELAEWNDEWKEEAKQMKEDKQKAKEQKNKNKKKKSKK